MDSCFWYHRWRTGDQEVRGEHEPRCPVPCPAGDGLSVKLPLCPPSARLPPKAVLLPVWSTDRQHHLGAWWMSRISAPAWVHWISLFFTGFPGNSHTLRFGRAGLTASFRLGRSCVLSPGTVQAPSQLIESAPLSWCPSPVCWSLPPHQPLWVQRLRTGLFGGRVFPGWCRPPFPLYTQPSSFWICLLSVAHVGQGTFAFISCWCSC